MKSTNEAAIVRDTDSGLKRLRPSTLPPPSHSGQYEALEGGVGREINFRPPRYPSSEFGPMGVVVTVALDDVVHECDLHDVSQNGVAFGWHGPRLAVGDVIPSLIVRFDGHDAYRGEARVSSVRVLDGNQIVGVSFFDSLMNIEDVLLLRDVKAWGAGPGLSVKDRPWRLSGHDRFKALVADFRLLLQDAEEQLGQLEASLPWHVVHGDQETPARAALVDRVRREIVDEVVSASNAINEETNQASAADWQALKEYSQRYLHEIFMRSPWMRRALEKPLGYPGDYELMNGVYGNNFAGNTLFAKALNMAFVSTSAGEAVRQRKNLIKRKLGELLDREPSHPNRPIRILSIAAGPAQETFELLHERTEIRHPVEIVLFDQDKRALAYSYGRLKRAVSSKWADRVKIVYLHDSIKRLLRDATLFSGFGEFDAIFSCGLFDYLQPRTAASLAGGFYKNLAPAGAVYIGNMIPENPSRWYMEFHLDWFLTYRTHADMIAFAKAGAPKARVEIVEEPTGINPFVMLTRD